MENDAVSTTQEKTLPIPVAKQEHPRINLKLTWKSVLVCVLVSAVSGLISAYLTLNRYAPHSAGDASEAAELAKTLREDWRHLYQKSVDERAALEARVSELNAQVARLIRAIGKHDAELASVRANTASSAAIRQGVELASRTDEGLMKESDNVLRDLGVKRVRILDSKKDR